MIEGFASEGRGPVAEFVGFDHTFPKTAKSILDISK
jgi:hypothetical protein